jgi:large repetitive protein
MAPGSDTEILNDESTLVPNPQFVAQVAANYPGSVSGLTVLAEFSGLHGGTFDLAPGLGQRGFVGNFDVQTTTDASGRFVIQAPFLPPGNKKVRVLVIGQPDSPPLPGLSSSIDHTFRIDNTAPFIVDATLTPGAARCPVGTPAPLFPA